MSKDRVSITRMMRMERERERERESNNNNKILGIILMEMSG